MATTQAIPTKRQDARGDVVIKVNLTESGSGAPAALKAWFYPGSIYGHEFVYSDAQARDISARTRTVVLSEDVSGSDAGKGTLFIYDAQGRKTAFQADEQAMKEWNDWKRNGRASAMVHAPGTAETRESNAPMIRTEPKGMRVSIGDLEEHPDRYLGNSGSYSAAAKMTDAAALATGTDTLVGRKVDLSGVKVGSTTRNGFWLDAGGHTVFVLPSAEAGQKVSTGQSVSVEGLVLEMPRSLRDKTHAAKSGNDEIYVYATTVK